MSGPRERAVAYSCALVIGAAAVAFAFPLPGLLGRAPRGEPFAFDLAQHIVGQRYWLAGAWRWPLLNAPLLDVPFGASVGMTDSIPLELLALKPFAPMLPAGFQGVTLWLALCWLLQPAAAVFALRGAGESRCLPALAVALLASAMPTFLDRIQHAALCSHFALLVALGLYLRLVRAADGRRWPLVCAGLLCPALLLIHPYLMLMAAALLAAAPLTLALRGDPRWRPAGRAVAAGFSVTALLAAGLGYGGDGAMAPGFGLFSMNLLSPVWPTRSALFAFAGVSPLDMTGGQYEGYQYLGAGLLGGLLVLLAARPRALPEAARRHPGLLLACLGSAALAASNRVYLGHALVLDVPAPDVLGIVRSSGRFFWPAAYVLLIGCVVLLARLPRRAAVPLLLVLPALQVFDASGLLRLDREKLALDRSMPFDDARLQAMAAASSLLSVYPPWPCDLSHDGWASLMDVLLVASRTLVPVDTMDTARLARAPRCEAGRLAAPVAPGELRVLLQGRSADVAFVPDAAAICRRLDTLTVCSADPSLLAGLPPAQVPARLAAP